MGATQPFPPGGRDFLERVALRIDPPSARVPRDRRPDRWTHHGPNMDVPNATFLHHYEHGFIYNEADIGIRSANLDLRIDTHRERVEEILRTTEVVVD